MKTATVDVDFVVPAIPEVYKDPSVFVRFFTTASGIPGAGQSLHVELHSNGRVSLIEILLDEFKGMWLKSDGEARDKLFESDLQELIATEETTNG